MRLLFGFFAKYADVMGDGSFGALGAGFDKIGVSPLPGAIPLAVVAQLAITPAERTDAHWLTLEVYAPDGAKIPSEGRSDIVSRPIPAVLQELETNYTCIFNMPFLPLTVAGVYRFRFTSDLGPIAQELELRVELIAQ